MKMDRILLGVVYLSGWIIFSSGLFHEYHFVNLSLNWYDAMTYCRQTYTNLATIDNTDEMNQIINISSAGNNSEVWIGVTSGLSVIWTHDIRDNYWDWENQTKNEPFLLHYFCYSVANNGGWYLENCSLEHPFICSNGTQLVYLNEAMDWFSAWKYCKKNYTDLTTPYDSTQYNVDYYRAVQNLIPNGNRTWIGLIAHPYIYWSDGSSSSFRYWDNFTKAFGDVWSQMCAAVDLQRSGKWRLLPCETTLPFVCYSPQVPAPTTTQAPKVGMKNKKVFKLRMSSSVDLNDPAQKANILTQLQNRLKEKGVSGVTLKWREQPDGKVFHKERNADVTHDEC
ncbi:secretory phospholipase A2 receptor-like [Anabas testudineus]|uniref:C-type lectin domain-containing protein n=1 Tax=Anabas testudineus TaxID=64144 RepID=A0A3Q1K904_ANATE|nr:secretory phospholipase A2 receptor-like [Anabas testudineus]